MRITLSHDSTCYCKSVIATLLALSLCACGAAQQRPSAKAPDKPLQGAEAAAAMLLDAEQAGGKRAARLRLEAAQLYLDAGQPGAAVAALKGMPADAPATDLWQRDLMLAGMLLKDNKARQARKLLRTPPAPVERKLRLQYLRHLATAQQALGDIMGAIHTFATGNEAVLHDELWQLLRQAPLSALKQQPTVAQDTYSGWIELAIIDQDLADSAENWSTAIIFWLQQYPMHPAQKDVLPLLRQQNYERHRGAGQVAVLLPRSGDLQPQASAIEYGILSAWYGGIDDRQPVLRFYDTMEGKVDALYRQAVSDGAELVIGPLQRENVDVINALVELPVPVLALNSGTVGAATAGNYYEFSLSPEDEVAQITQKAWFDGHQAAVILAPDSDYGKRLEQLFQEKWQALGGLVIPAEPLADSQDAIRSQLSDLMHVRISKLRIEQLQQLLGVPLSAPNRNRGDVGCIFLAAPENIARQVGPQMRFLDLEHIQVYAMSDIYRGDSSREAALDMDLIQFPAMPWLLDPEPAGGDDLKALEQWISSPELFAFGIDAFNIALGLGKLTARADAEHGGATGTLRFDANRIVRQMTWATFYGGNATTVSLYEKSLDPKLQR